MKIEKFCKMEFVFIRKPQIDKRSINLNEELFIYEYTVGPVNVESFQFKIFFLKFGFFLCFFLHSQGTVELEGAY